MRTNKCIQSLAVVALFLYHPGEWAVVHKINHAPLRNLYGPVCEAGDAPPGLRASHWLKPVGENMSSHSGVRCHLQYFICYFCLSLRHSVVSPHALPLCADVFISLF